jgi:A/G-specific adenine glycosylase
MRIEEKFKQRLRRRLLSWYEKHRRDMPWRETDDPYKIWVSEIMLQQTQVKTVESYYHAFVRRFPTVEGLAKANLHEVMKVWEGLGYYGRARNLHRAAREVVSRFDGRIPDNIHDLISLPGIGRYTAGAILSIAFHQPVAILDGNVMRLLSRVFHVTENVDKSETRNVLWNIARDILPRKRVQDFNQGLMELGNMVCRPRQPLCDMCPVAPLCEAKRLSIQAQLPVRTPRKPIPHHDVTAGIIWKGDRLLITLRPPRGLLGGLWEFPGGTLEAGETLQDCLKREIREELGIDIEVGDPVVSVKHAYTHFKITLHAFHCRYAGGKIRCLACDDYRWITTKDFGEYAFPAADRKIIEILEKESIIKITNSTSGGRS